MRGLLDVVLLVMQNGGSTVMADRTFQNVLKGYRQNEVTAIWRLDFVAEGRSSTVLQPVGPRLKIVVWRFLGVLGLTYYSHTDLMFSYSAGRVVGKRTFTVRQGEEKHE